MTHHVTHNLRFGKKLLLAAAGVAAVATPILIGIMHAPQMRAQSQPEKRLAFEVASVKANKSADPRSFGTMKGEPGGRLIVRESPLYMIIAAAYNVSFQSPRLSGGPDWIRSERYDIEATPEKGAIPAELPAKEQDARMRLMLQTLLADRFKLKVLRETKELPVYVLLVGKNGPKLRESKVAEKDCADPKDPEKKGVPCHRFMGGQGRGLHGTAVNMADLVGFVENWTDRPLIDKTGIERLYDIESEGWLPMRPRQPPSPGTPPSAEDLAFSDPAIPTLFMIFERLGLKMEPQKAPIETYVIDHVERPTEN
ncbi:MAG: TIGR03435 family protein [Acidobacteriia bacterium]|nr:TIGR03435 family protein [Terriglobia bacterium]